VVPALDGEQALERLRAQSFDLVMLDVMLPRLDGFEVCRRVRAESSVPIIMLTAKAEEVADRVLGLELGADDYIVKSCSMRELRSRVKAVLRRAQLTIGDARAEEPLVHGDLSIDPAKRHVHMRGELVKLTFFEFEILHALARQPGRVFSRAELLEHVLGDSEYRDQRTIDVHIRHLREKLESDPANPELILTERRVGYRFQDR
jgi:DNA-binding response OmpR family regulator